MIKLLKQWLTPSDHGDELFLDSQNPSLHRALAAVLFRLIAADGNESDMERLRFAQIFTEEFGLEHDQIRQLYFAARNENAELDDALAILDKHLNAKRSVRMAFFSMLNSLMGIDGVMVSEMKVLDQILAVVLPERSE